MSAAELNLVVRHPYQRSSRAHENFLPTTIPVAAFSAACIPYRWMLAQNAPAIAAEYGIEYDAALEARVHELTDGFGKTWVQDHRNQLALLDTFFSAIQREKSLCFFYAKRTPMSDDPQRVILGVGEVTSCSGPVEYSYSGRTLVRSVTWERVVGHSIRPDGGRGLLMPYHEILTIARDDSSIEFDQLVATAPEGAWTDFSYGAEHVSNDAAIASLAACSKALEASKALVTKDLRNSLTWIDEKLNALWQMRGPSPGLGSALTAFGLERGTTVAMAVASHLSENEDPWPLVDRIFHGAAPEVPVSVDQTLSKKWQMLPDDRRALLKLLARFELTASQAERYYQKTVRDAAGISTTDGRLLENPYLLYELDREQPEPIAVGTVDRGAYPVAIVQDKHPLPAPTALTGAVDERRVRALCVAELERAASDGHTLLAEADVIQRIRDTALTPPCPVDADLIEIVRPTFSPPLRDVQMAAGDPALQLSHLAAAGKLISREVTSRRDAEPLPIAIDWRRRLDDVLGSVSSGDETEEAARVEKSAALETLATSRISVLIGAAGTGKTTLLRVLCSESEIMASGILLLAPTGKARVRLQQVVGHGGGRARTIAQFLLPSGRYLPEVGVYRLGSGDKHNAARTVVIDEASMLTEPQLAATLDALAGVHRLILVGDPRQLPPIGAGRPFVDIVTVLAPYDVGSRFPRVDRSYAELTLRRRGGGVVGDDLRLANWFAGASGDPTADDVWNIAPSGNGDPRLRLERWERPADLPGLAMRVVGEELGLVGSLDEPAFDAARGAAIDGDYAYFNRSQDASSGPAQRAEEWQILSAIRGTEAGVGQLNRTVQRTFRPRTLESARHPRGKRRFPKPAGTDEIIYGDKVISVRNQGRRWTWPKDAGEQYVANGEIGVVVGEFASHERDAINLEVEYATQRGTAYKYSHKELSGESDAAPLELGYAITVHKSQGSQFRWTLVVLPNPCRLLSRELLYTALTRHEDRLVVLYQGDLRELRHFANPAESETARRLTNLFSAPSPVKVERLLVEEALINRTNRGDLVKSKSELVIANELHDKDVPYEYQRELRAVGGGVRYPDFTIDVPQTGRRVFWEHLGLLHDPEYAARWEKKVRWYEDLGILPEDRGGGPGGTLVTTRDSDQGGIDSGEIRLLVERLFG